MNRRAFSLFFFCGLLLVIIAFCGNSMMLLVKGEDMNSIADWYKSIAGFILLAAVVAKKKQTSFFHPKYFFIIILILLVIVGFYLKIKRSAVKTQEQAVILLKKKAKGAKLRAYWAISDCANFETGDLDEKNISIKVFEKHGGKCLGNPNIRQQVASFKVNKKNGRILWYYTALDAYISFEDYVKMMNKTIDIMP